MRKVFALYWALVRNGQRQQPTGKRTKQQKLIALTHKLLTIAVIGIITGVVFIYLLRYAKEYGPMFSEEEMLLAATRTALFCGTVVTMAVLLPLALFRIFLAKDVASYLSLPFRGWQILLAKMLTMIGYAWVASAALTLPQLIGYGISLQAGIGYWAKCAVVCLFMPCIPISYLSGLSVLLQHICVRYKNKSRIFTGITYGVWFIAAMLTLMTRGDGDIDSMIRSWNASSLVQAIAVVLQPTAPLAQSALFESQVLPLAEYVVANVCAMALFVWGFGRLYERRLAGVGDVSIKRAAMMPEELAAQMSAQPLRKAIHRVQWHAFSRSPIYVMNCLTVAIVVPIFFIALLVLLGWQVRTNPELGSAAMAFAPRAQRYLPVFSVLLAGCVTMFNRITSTCVSRMGTGIYLIKSLPIPEKMQLRYLSAVGRESSLILSSIVTVILTGGIVWLLQLPFQLVAYCWINAVLTSLIIDDFQLLRDLSAPNVKWETEIEALRRSSIYEIIGLVIFLGIIMAACAVFLSAIGPALSFLQIGILIAMAIASRAMVFHLGPGYLKRI